MLSNFMEVADDNKIGELFMKVGLYKQKKVISRLESLKKKDDLKLKFEDLWLKISKIHKTGGEELETLTIKEQNKMKKRRSVSKYKLNTQSNFIFSN